MTSSVRNPRGRVLVNNITIIPLSLSATRNGNYKADEFSFSAPIFGTALQGGQWWLTQDQDVLTVDIQLGMETDGQTVWRSVLKGIVDEVVVDWGQGIVDLKGRDKTSLFIDHKILDDFKNKTASEIVTALAAKRGLKTDVAATTELSGRYYAEDHTRTHGAQFSKATTEWDLITYLARHAGMDAWVDGDTLHFKKLEDETETWNITYRPPTLGDNYSVAKPSTVITLKSTHRLALSKDIVVTVRSWHTGSGKGVKVTNNHRKKKKGGPAGFNATAGKKGKDAEMYVMTYPNLTQAQAQAKANELYDSLVKHEYIIDWSEPGDATLTPRHKVKVSTDPALSVLDQSWFVDEIEFHMDIDGGFLMTCRAKNHPDMEQVTE